MKAWERSKMAEKFSGGVRVVSEVAMEMRRAIIGLAGNREVFDSRERWLDRAARAAGITRRMAKSFFYCECADPKASIVDRVREAIEKNKAEDAEAVTAARIEYQELLERVARLEAALVVQDADFHRP